MAKIAIVSIPYWGHVNVTLSLGTLLLSQGHEVTWLLPKKLAGLLLPDGGSLALTNEEDDERVLVLLDKLDSGKSKAALEGSKFVIEEVLLPLARLMHDGLDRYLSERKPDLVIHDEQTYIGGICSYKRNIPYITTHAAPSGIYETSLAKNISSWYFGLIQEFQTEFDLPGQPCILRSTKLGIAFCPREFANPHQLMDAQVFVGPCIDVVRKYKGSFDYARILNNGNKNIMVSIGTLLTAEAETFFGRIISDFRDTHYNVIVAADPSIFSEWPANFIVQNRVPHLDLIKHIDIVITHGGANTVCDCIGMGIPMVVIPMAFDQYYVADQVALNNLGKRLKYRRIKPMQIRDSCEQMLLEVSRDNSQLVKFSQIYRDAGGAHRAAELVNSFIETECN